MGLPQTAAQPEAGAGGELEQVLQLYREQYFDFNVQHFHEKLRDEHGIQFSYTWVKTALQEAGLVKKRKKPGSHRKRRPRRPLPGMMLHIDGSEHRWFGDQRQYELICSAGRCDQRDLLRAIGGSRMTRTVMAALREVIESKRRVLLVVQRSGGTFLSSPRGAAARSMPTRPTQVGRALQELGVKMIPAYSPQARGRMERNFGTWQGRLPQELRMRGITDRRESQSISAQRVHRRVQRPVRGSRRRRKEARLCGFTVAKIWTGSSACSMNGR